MPVIEDHFALRAGITPDHAGNRNTVAVTKNYDDYRHDLDVVHLQSSPNFVVWR